MQILSSLLQASEQLPSIAEYSPMGNVLKSLPTLHPSFTSSISV